ncbi:translation termination factor GTPase eRF3 [Rhodotorula sphaerocarpa]
MFARSFSLSALAALVFALFLAGHAEAGMAQGNLDLSRDYLIEYNTGVYHDTEAFCRALRSECVKYAGPLGQHHQIDCVFELPDGSHPQPGPQIRAFCGGIQKQADGSWNAKRTPVEDHTRAVLGAHFSGKAWIKQKPFSYAKCAGYARSHPEWTCSKKWSAGLLTSHLPLALFLLYRSW